MTVPARTRTAPHPATTLCQKCGASTAISKPNCERCDWLLGQRYERPDQEPEAPADPAALESGTPPPNDFPPPNEKRKRGRTSSKPQHHMSESAITHGELEPLLRRRAELMDELEPDEEAKRKGKELREANKRMRQIVTGMVLADGRYRVAMTGWVLDVTNQPGGSKTVDYGDSVKLKVETIE